MIPLNRKMRRQLQRENEKRPKALTLVPRDQWPVTGNDTKRTHVWLNQDYLVQEFYEEPGIVRLSVSRTKALPNGRWDDGITWDELQLIKRQVGYGASYAIEIYPRDIDVVNVANMRHLWILPAPLDIGWFK